ncbi:MCE family protein [Nocardioides sp. W3-2-3]|uniref:MlaD family protein n=1 Tax=Nocardioides convexus TaxID=2712224 RepID=UPI002418A4F3|nr:MlaD family protein [Nocardioides convexus]NHA00494.1 MCE family protein [Nocardioides convexus]
MSSTTTTRGVVVTLTKSLVFALATVLATLALAGTIRNSSEGARDEYVAYFSDVTSLNKGDDVRMAGVKVGTVRLGRGEPQAAGQGDLHGQRERSAGPGCAGRACSSATSSDSATSRWSPATSPAPG